MRIPHPLILLVAALFLGGCQTVSHTKLSTENGYTASAATYLPSEDIPGRDIVFIVIHGKSGGPDTPHQLSLYPKLADAGYEIIAPKMPWSRDWEGTLDDGMAIIDAAVSEVTRRQKEVVLIGHSLGGTTALIYASRSPRKGVLGIVAVAPGHMLHRSNRMQQVTADSVTKANRMVARGDGASKATFKELNNGRVRDRYMSADAYLSYYDLRQFPITEKLLPEIQLPVLWIAGEQDRLTQIYHMEALFGALPDNNESEFLEITGDHKGVLANSAAIVILWSEGLRDLDS